MAKKKKDLFRIVSTEMKSGIFEVYGGETILIFKNSNYRMKIEISIPNKEAFKIDPTKLFSLDEIEEIAEAK